MKKIFVMLTMVSVLLLTGCLGSTHDLTDIQLSEKDYLERKYEMLTEVKYPVYAPFNDTSYFIMYPYTTMYEYENNELNIMLDIDGSANGESYTIEAEVRNYPWYDYDYENGDKVGKKGNITYFYQKNDEGENVVYWKEDGYYYEVYHTDFEKSTLLEVAKGYDYLEFNNLIDLNQLETPTKSVFKENEIGTSLTYIIDEDGSEKMDIELSYWNESDQYNQEGNFEVEISTEEEYLYDDYKKVKVQGKKAHFDSEYANLYWEENGLYYHLDFYEFKGSMKDSINLANEFK